MIAFFLLNIYFYNNLVYTIVASYNSIIENQTQVVVRMLTMA